MQIGLAGTGKMGAAITRRLLASGCKVIVWNRNAARAQPLLQAGATWSPTPRGLVEAADTVITMLTDDTALEAVYNGEAGLLKGSFSGRLFIDMSTVSPLKPQALGTQVVAGGAHFLECPVSGSVGPAAEGKLFGFVGGDVDSLERARDLLGLLCRRIEHVGGLGAGATMKLAVNLPLMVYWQTLGEALSLLQPLGLDPSRVLDILADTSGGPNMLKTRGPLIAKALAGEGDGSVSVDLATMSKDLRAMLAQGAAGHYSLPLAALTLQNLERASRSGLAAADCTQLPVWWLQQGGRT